MFEVSVKKGEAATDADAPGQGQPGHPVPLEGGLKAGGVSQHTKHGWTRCAVWRWKVTRTSSLDFLSNFEGSNGEVFSDPSGHWRAKTVPEFHRPNPFMFCIAPSSFCGS